MLLFKSVAVLAEVGKHQETTCFTEGSRNSKMSYCSHTAKEDIIAFEQLLYMGLGAQSHFSNKKKLTYTRGHSIYILGLDTLKTKKQKSQKQPVAHDMTPSHVKQLKTKLLSLYGRNTAN